MRFIEKDLETPLVQEAIIRLSLASDYDKDSRVRDIIRILYSGCCAYCECKPEAGASYQIEHFYPKDKDLGFSKWRKDIRNLHYSCPACNTKKHLLVPHEFLSPNYILEDGRWVISNSREIEDRMRYRDFMLFTTALDEDDKKAFNTINKLHLNSRPYLVESRIRCFHRVTVLLQTICGLLSARECDNEVLSILFKLLIEHTETKSEYSTMVIQNYGAEIIKLLKIWEKKKDSKSLINRITDKVRELLHADMM